MTKPEDQHLTAEPFENENQFEEIKLVVSQPLPESHPAYALIGRVAAEWARMEHILDTIIWELAGLEPAEGSCLTAPQFGYRARLKMMLGLIAKHQLSIDIMKEAQKVEKMVSCKAENRNNYVHNAWFTRTGNNSKETLGQFKSFARKSKTFGFQAIPIKEITDTAAEISLICSYAISLKKMISYELTASQ